MFDTVRYLKWGGRSGGRSSKSRQHGSGDHRRLLCEALEARTLLSGLALVADLPDPSGVSGDKFGNSVSISGNTMVVGTPDATVGSNSQQGAAYVFTGSGSSWTQVAKLTELGGAPGDHFGYSVAISNNTVVVGAPGAGPVNSNSFPMGASYVFTESANGWADMTQAAKLSGSDKHHMGFGYSVSIGGNTIVVGAKASGTAYVFTKPTGGWTGTMTETADLNVNGQAVNAPSMVSINESGNTVVAGAPGGNWDNKNGVFRGAAYVFTGSGASWTMTAELITGSDLVSGLGTSVSISGSTVVASASGTNSVYVFTNLAARGKTVTPTATLTASDAPSGYGSSVSISGNTVVVGSPYATVGTNLDQGAAYVFTEPTGGWTNMTDTSPTLTASNGVAYDEFGNSVSISGTTAVVGALYAPCNLSTKTEGPGAAYVFADPPAQAVSAGALAKPAARALAWPGQAANSSNNSDQQRKMEVAILALEDVFADYGR